MNKITIAFLAGLILSTAGCRWGGIIGNGHIVTDTRSVSDFSEIQAGGGFEIEWRNGPPSLSITADENLLPHIESQNIDHQLRVRTRGSIWSSHAIKVAISSPTRAGARLTGASRLQAESLQTKSAEISSTGASHAEVAVSEALKVSITGAGKVIYSGNPPVIEKHISGAGSIRHKD